MKQKKTKTNNIAKLVKSAPLDERSIYIINEILIAKTFNKNESNIEIADENKKMSDNLIFMSYLS